MGARDRGQALERRDARQDRLAMGGMRPHRGPFLLVELAGLVQDGVADAELADVVQQRGALEPAALARPGSRSCSAIMSAKRVTRSLWPLV